LDEIEREREIKNKNEKGERRKIKLKQVLRFPEDNQRERGRESSW